MHRRDLLKCSLLTGIAVCSSSLSRAILAGVTGGAVPSSPVFSGAQRQSVQLLADMIIPPTDTPGAVEAGVPGFIESIVGDWYRDGERRIFFQGLLDLDDFCLAREQLRFNDAGEEARVAALVDQQQRASSYQAPSTMSFVPGAAIDPEAPFFKKLKELVVTGYYTSEIGTKQEMAYLPMPMRYDGAYDFAKVGRQWSY